jgi:hypothetical protein
MPCLLEQAHMRRSDVSHDIHSSAADSSIVKSSPSSEVDSSRANNGMADRDPRERSGYDLSISGPLSGIDTMVEAYEGATSETERRLYLRAIARELEVVTGQLHDRIGALVDALSEHKR